MKRLLVVGIAVFLGFSSSAQIKVGLKASPNLSWSAVTHNNDSISGNGLKARAGGGVLVDFLFSENYGIGTGINYTTKGAGFTRDITDTSGVRTYTSTYSLQYLEVPVTVKLFTNEIMDYTKLYFQVGVSGNVNLAAKVNGDKVYPDPEDPNRSIDYTDDIKLFEASLIVSAGIEMEMGDNTNFLAGFTYNRGLTNIDATGTFDSPNQLKNEYLSLDVGLKF